MHKVYSGASYTYEKLTVTTAVKQLTALKYAPVGEQKARSISITAESFGIRITWDGTNPSATDGHPIPAGTSFEVHGYQNIVALKMYRLNGTDATVHITYLR